MPLAAQDATFDGVTVTIGKTQVAAKTTGGILTATFPVEASAATPVRIAYRSHGPGTWAYHFGTDSTGVRDFDLVMDTNFRAIDFPPHTLVPTAELEIPQGWELTWSYRDLITGNGIGMTLPDRLQPGPLAQRITLWAPVALLFSICTRSTTFFLRGRSSRSTYYSRIRSTGCRSTRLSHSLRAFRCS